MKSAFNWILVAAALAGFAVPAAAETRVYVPLGSAGKAVVIDAARDQVVDVVSDLPDVHGLAGTADGAFLVAGSYAETPRAEEAAPPKPEGMPEDEHAAHHAKPAGPSAPTVGAVGFVTVVRADDGAILRRIEVPGAVHHVVVTPDGRYAVATHPNQGGISVIDLAEFRVVATVHTGPSTNYAVVGAGGNFVYVSNAGNNTVSEIDTERWIVRRNLLVGGESPEHIVLSPDGSTLYVANVDDGTVAALSLPDGTVARTFAVGGALHGIDLSDDGGTLFVSGREENKLVAIDLESAEMKTAPLGPSPYHLAAITGIGKLYVSSAEEPKIWVVDQQDLRVLREIPLNGVGHQMVVVQR
jgi:DNA-binding beta-propeller fold protein YncE